MLYVLLILVFAALSVVLTIHTRSLLRANRESLENERRFQQMADNIQEIFWMMDAETRKLLYVNQAYETITGRSCHSLQESPSSYQEAIHSEDRPHVLSQLGAATRSGHFEEKFRIVLPDRTLRWVWARGFPVEIPAAGFTGWWEQHRTSRHKSKPRKKWKLTWPWQKVPGKRLRRCEKPRSH